VSDADALEKESMADSHAVTPTAAGPSASWLADACEKVRALLSLSPGWDSYSARAISTAAAKAAFQVLDDAARLGCPAPSIVPMSRGGIQVEWHIRQWNIEVTVPPDGSPVEVWGEDLISRTEQEFLVDGDPGPLREILTRLAQRTDG